MRRTTERDERDRRGAGPEMKATDRPESATAEALEALPCFELDYYVDDRENPTRVMVMPISLEVGSSEQWITIDAEHAVPLDEVR